MQLKGKIAVIPGASRPIGRAIAKSFAEAGATLILPVFDWPESIVSLQEEFQSASFDFLIIHADLRKKEQVSRLAGDVRQRYGFIDFLINNIERGGMPVIHGSYDLPVNSEQWDLEFATTVTAKWLLYHHFFPLLKMRQGGAVVNISSIAGNIGRSGPAAPFFSDGYSAANRAISSFTESWAKEAGPSIRVNQLSLGFIQHRHGEGTLGWSKLSESEKASLRNTIVLGRTGLPEEVARAVYFLAVEASYCTGATLRIDGGYVLGSAPVPTISAGCLE
jgi:3-oxoacyl-[acyl-carrier protein] reductase